MKAPEMHLQESQRLKQDCKTMIVLWPWQVRQDESVFGKLGQQGNLGGLTFPELVLIFVLTPPPPPAQTAACLGCISV